MVEIDLGGEGAFLGRAPGSTVELPFPDISGTHARLFQQEDWIYFEDLGSTNGSYAGDRRLAPHLPVAVGLGESLRLGSITFRLESGGGGEVRVEGVVEGTETLARRLVADLFCACPPAEPTAIEVEAGPDTGKVLSILVPGRRYLAGRGPSCDLVLADPDVSREHVAFLRTSEGIQCLDLESKNGAFLDGERIQADCFLRDGNHVSIGGTVLRILDPEDRYLRQMEAADAAAKEAEIAQARVDLSLVTDPPTAESADGSGDPEFKAPLFTPVSGSSSSSDPIPADVRLPSPANPKTAQRSFLPYVVGGVAGVVLLGLIGVVLALAFGLWK